MFKMVFYMGKQMKLYCKSLGIETDLGTDAHNFRPWSLIVSFWININFPINVTVSECFENEARFELFGEEFGGDIQESGSKRDS